MNATELAFLLDKSREESYTSENLVGKAATMLRQQQAEIEALKANPVKELTDEEINWLAKAYSTMEGELNAPAFARAILRKAQDK
jgi:hypothetical protein